MIFITLIIIKLKIVDGAYSYEVREQERYFIKNLTQIFNSDQFSGSGDIPTDEPTEATSSTNEPAFGGKTTQCSYQSII